MNHYLYRHVRLDKNEPFYIGIGTKPITYTIWEKEFSRAFDKKFRNKLWKGIISRTAYEVEILFESDDYDQIKEKEKDFIALYGRIINGIGTLCNLTEGGDGAKGYTHSEKSKLKNSIKHKGKKASIETKLKQSNAHKGHKPMLGKKQSLDHIKNAAEGKYKKVERFSLIGELIKTYNSIRETKVDGFDPPTVSNCCNNKRKSHANFIWKFKKDIQEKERLDQ